MSAENYTRRIAARLTAQEFNELEVEGQEDSDERPANLYLLPSGKWVNRVAVVGVLTDVIVVNDGDGVVLRISDGSASMDSDDEDAGVFRAYAGQYDKGVVNKMREVEEQDDVPQFVTVVGQPNIYETDDGEVRRSIQNLDSVSLLGSPEESNAHTREKWAKETVEQTLERLENSSGDVEDLEGEAAEARENYSDEVRQQIHQSVITLTENVAE